MSRLNPTNPEHIIYNHPPLDIAVLGGIRLEGLDRMRVTLKIRVEHLSLPLAGASECFVSSRF